MSQTNQTAAAQTADLALSYPSPLKEFWQGFSHNKGAVAGLVFVLFIVACALFAPLIAPYSPIEQYRDHMLTPPAWEAAGSAQFLFGTDELGRDILSRLIYGARLSLFIGLMSVLMALVPGVILGLLAAFFPKALGASIMRLMDIMMALPSLLLAVAIMAILGPGLTNAMIAIATVSLPAYVRLTRASAMTELNRDYVVASRVAGAGLMRLMFVTVLPNCMAPLIVHATMSFSSAILEIAALGFLGLACSRRPPSGAPCWPRRATTSRAPGGW
ncbi:Dipeptide transport system permease protein dppC [Chromobacterium violaceum]|uniref:Dipeptide transport system permease protein dppC n=1 Tax=Chromobacterium violaceum TaxID=536 RepID=A0A447T8D7_CHRVL|nr:Dipeptide transport system permease protein dppC [Chromobacterium violaceum]